MHIGTCANTHAHAKECVLCVLHVFVVFGDITYLLQYPHTLLVDTTYLLQYPHTLLVDTAYLLQYPHTLLVDTTYLLQYPHTLLVDTTYLLQYPHTLYLVTGTQLAQTSSNTLVLMKMSNLGPVSQKGEGSDSEGE